MIARDDFEEAYDVAEENDDGLDKDEEEDGSTESDEEDTTTLH